jgi:hypothetical protein
MANNGHEILYWESVLISSGLLVHGVVSSTRAIACKKEGELSNSKETKQLTDDQFGTIVSLFSRTSLGNVPFGQNVKLDYGSFV